MYATKEYVDRVEIRLRLNMRMLKEDIHAIGETVVELLNGQQRLETKVDNLETKVGSMETKVGNLETKVGNLETKVDNLETKVDRTDANVRAIMDHLGVPRVEVPKS